ncbi:DUF5320 domain-containing protein [Tindallia californiensis]|uniref:DUF5320 domain-containing protein n=1 Tax=Tindallia californiensis TaxID=159292 RepID=A0A1H3MED0_9FIRM|nr:DUF5320 domain-containing protein [Tindallia californiensis]SDY75040.1 hypothetical protein SAMN05192546_104104 [Tindallia californiensis]
MPGRDGTGPIGRGEATGRGMGFCMTPGRWSGCRRPRRGYGRGIRAGAKLGFGRGEEFCRPILTEAEEKEWLKREKEMLKEELKSIEQTLGGQFDEIDGK